MTEPSREGEVLRQVVVPRRIMEDALRHLLRNQQRVALGRAGINRTPRLVELICRELRPLPVPSTASVAPWVLVTLGRGEGPSRERRLEMLRMWGDPLSSSPVALISIDQQAERGRFDAIFRSPAGEMEPVHALKIVGPGMHRELTLEGAEASPIPELTPREREKWSRSIGAMGDAAWRRLRSLHFCIVGVGRTGSLVATSLTRWGVRQMTLVDPDRLELHNVDSMDGVTDRDVGRLKVSSVRDYLVSIGAQNGATFAVAESITSLQAFAAAKEADFLICSVDHDGARVATAIIAALFCKPVLDLGTGIFNEAGSRRMGGDIRLILPGERCLLCFGGISNLEAGRSIFSAPSRPPAMPWRQQRAGSSRALNQTVSHLGLLQVQDVILERLDQSQWLHLELDNHGLPTIQSIDPPANPVCPLCQRFGEGDEGLSRVRELQSALTESTTR